ncbi:putative glycerol-1-phosphate prenyltransferase [Microbacter margulisiae]|uniref:Geranylgeranylglyceryl phosphate synthase n=2 Tax=Microbacter margulisiae TaxID=1350067 RepID=A0A7W5DR67_9PORP|nr:putative glycerol-1-phosphate prenyltransferase [Microbacter margulisiae]
MDPDHFIHQEQITQYITYVKQAHPDMILIGGSLTTQATGTLIKQIKRLCTLPLVLFPGNIFQFTTEADALLLLSLISGRNPELLIGQHVAMAQTIKKSGIEAISTGYMLVESDQTTTVEYISNTRPLPHSKPQIAAATAIAGTLLGNQLIYLEAGSGAKQPVPTEMITEVKKSIEVPLIVGGGLRRESAILDALTAGADAIVVGNALEKNPELMIHFAHLVHRFNQ